MRATDGKTIFVSIPTNERAERLKFEGVLDYAHGKPGCKWRLEIDPGGTLPRVAADFRRFSFDGVIAYVTDRTTRALLAGLRCPRVLIEDLEEPSKPVAGNKSVSIVCDHFEEGRAAARYFIERHHTRFAWVGPTHVTQWAERRRDGFVDALRESGFGCACYRPPKGEARNNFSLEIQKLAAWLGALPRPCAVFACRDVRARQVIAAANEADIPVPEGIAVLGVDDDEIVCQTTDPSISSITTSDHDIGYAAGQELDSLLRGRSRGHVRRTKSPGIVTRLSTDIEAVGDAYVAKALQYVRQHLNEPIDADRLAALVGLPSHALQARAEHAFGITLGREIQRIRLRTAAALLSGSDESVESIAETCGFASTSYLSLRMRKFYGKTPLQYRRSQRT